jgi:ABC-2 type transport system permease protein
MSSLLRGIVRASSFFRKEIFEILRQPRLVATLILGPFLILLIFGVGYRDQPRNLRTLFVAQSDSLIADQEIEQYGKTMSSLLTYSGVTDNEEEALARLKRREVELVIVVPSDALETVQNNEQAVFTLYHREIDPAQVDYVEYLGWLYVGAIRQQMMRVLASEGQESAGDWHVSLQQARENLSALRQAIQNGNELLAQQKQKELLGNVDAVGLAIGTSVGLLNNLDTAGGGNDSQAIQGTLSDLNEDTDLLADPTATTDERLARIDEIEGDLTDLETRLATFQEIEPSIMVNPFRSETKSIASLQPTVSDFFAPAVLALLLQHLAVTFAALSIVRERNTGTMELFRVSPLSAGEALFGKYMSYMVFGGIIAAALSALLVFVLHMPMLGNWLYLVLVIAAVLFTSLGIGFFISIISQTDTQAVQYSMITLLASVFFSGFIMSLNTLWEPVRVISWMLPNTYGTFLLRDIALRGIAPDWTLLGGLVAIGLFLMLVSWRLMKRLITIAQ